MREGLKQMWGDFRNRIRYYREYKDNKNYCDIKEAEAKEYEEKLEALNKKLEEREAINKEKDNLIVLLNNRIDTLNSKITQLKIDDKTKASIIQDLKEQLENMTDKYHEAEHRRRQTVAEISHRQRTINKLEKENEKKDHKINFLKTSRHAPTKEEIIAYETSMREVEKRQKQKNKNPEDNTRGGNE